MASGSVTIRVRPIRIALLVDPADRAGLYQAIELNSLLWGGSYNPIIPVYRRTPAQWLPPPRIRLPTPTDIVEGYLNGFDPDLVVPVGKCVGREFQVGNRDLVEPDKLAGDPKDSSALRYGVGITEVLADFLEKEFKYKRHDNLEIVIPELPRAYRLFLASVLGALPNSLRQALEKRLSDVPGVSKVRPALEQFAELLAPGRVFPHG